MPESHGRGLRPEDAVIVGGGLAGLSAACELADHGVRVTLLEKRPHLGGRAYSFKDRETGEEIDNGQHIFMIRLSEQKEDMHCEGALA